jgi:hypothetical protein
MAGEGHRAVNWGRARKGGFGPYFRSGVGRGTANVAKGRQRPLGCRKSNRGPANSDRTPPRRGLGARALLTGTRHFLTSHGYDRWGNGRRERATRPHDLLFTRRRPRPAAEGACHPGAVVTSLR